MIIWFVMPYFFHIRLEWKTIEETKRNIDKEYPCTSNLEFLYLKECGIRYEFVKTINGVQTYKYRKTPELFENLAKFYKTKQLNFKKDW